MPAPTTSPLTADEIARTETRSFDFQVRFYVGGQRGYIPEGSIWSRDWTNSHAGITDFTTSSTLNGAIAYDDTTLTLANASGFLAGPATVFIEPADSAHAWERVVYTGISSNNLTGCIRRPVIWPPDAYSHASGSTVWQWVDVTDRILPDFDVSWFRRGNMATWNIPLTGVAYNRELFDRGNSFIIQVRFDHTNTGVWTDWVVWFAGYILDLPRVGYDRDDANLFQFNVGGLASYVLDAPAHHIGKHDIAKNKPTVTSSVLINPALEATGEYLINASVDGSRAVDGDVSTPWVSQGAPLAVADSYEPLDQQRNLYISEVYFGLSAFDQQNMWVEIYNPGSSPRFAGGNYLTNRQTVYDNDMDVSNGSVPRALDYFITLPNVDIPANGYLIMCLNLTSFEQFWTVIDEQAIGPYDWRKLSRIDAPFINEKQTFGANRSRIRFNRTGDWLQLRNLFGVQTDMVVWGQMPVAAIALQTNEGGHLFSGDPVGWPDHIPDGYSIRRIHNAVDGGGYTSVTANDWEIVAVPSPGSRRSYYYGEYISVDVGLVPTRLTKKLLQSDTEAEVENDTFAFPPTGSFVIGTEVVSYTSRDSQKFYGLGARSNDYDDGTPLIPYVNGSANQHYPVNVLGWQRPVGAPFPSDFEVWASADASPRYPVKPEEHLDFEPPNEDWKDDWTRIAEGKFSSSDTGLYKWSYLANSTLYYRHYMLLVREMSDSGRVKVGEIFIIADASAHTDSDASSHDLDGSRITDVVKHLLVEHMGMAEAKFTYPASIEDTLVVIHNLDLQKGNVWQTVESLCRLTGYYVIENPAFGVRLKLDPLFPFGEEEILQYDFDRDSIESPMNISLPNHRQVSQIELRARDLSSGEMFTAYWPPTANRYGEKRRVDNLMLGSEAHARAFAVNLFRRANFGSTVVLRPTGICEWVTPAMLIGVAWSQDTSDNPFLQRREFVVTGVQWSVRASNAMRKLWTCELACEEYVGS